MLCGPLLLAQTVSGTVTNSVTREPIQGATVALIGPKSGDQHPITTDVLGGFRIVHVAPGNYGVIAAKNGYEPSGIMTSHVHVEAGVDPMPVDFLLAPWPAVRGRVLDADRNPVAKLPMRLIPFRGVPPNPVTTDPEGRYEFKSVSPGSYALLANPLEVGRTEFAPTYYPTATSTGQSVRITARAGPDLSGYDIVLRGGPFFHVRGCVSHEGGRPAAGAEVTVETADATLGTAVADSDGAFQIDHVPPVDGQIVARLKDGETELRGSTAILIERHHIDIVELRISPPVPVRGVVELDGKGSSPGLGMYGGLAPVEGRGKVITAITGDRDFFFVDVYPGRYLLHYVPPAREEVYVEAVMLGDRDIAMQEFSVTPGMPPLRVLLRTGGGQVMANVENPGVPVVVLLVPQDPRLRYDPFVLHSMPSTDSHFGFANVRPGEYYALALARGFRSTDIDDPSWLTPLLSQAKAVHVERGSTSAVEFDYVK